MAYIHETESVIEDDRLGTITVIVETDKFKYEAVGSKAGAVHIFVDWYDKPGDMTFWLSWNKASSHFQYLMNRVKAKV